jgi:hypothetical protein
MAPDIRASVPDFDGFEAAAFWEDRIFLVIEARRADGTTYGYLVRGTVAPGLAHITLDFDRVAQLPPPSDQPNIGYESLLVSMGVVVVIGEANGPGMVAMVFDPDLNHLGNTLFPPVPYRLTDVTPRRIAFSGDQYWCGVSEIRSAGRAADRIRVFCRCVRLLCGSREGPPDLN